MSELRHREGQGVQKAADEQKADESAANLPAQAQQPGTDSEPKVSIDFDTATILATIEPITSAP